MSAASFLALDWGTTNLRAWLIGSDGAVLKRRDFPFGVGSLAAGEAEHRFYDTILPALLDGEKAKPLPAILCGMIGSNLGWTPVPYRDCPESFDSIAMALHRVKTDYAAPVWIVPGLRTIRPDGSPDVMRGEETHLFGWATSDPAGSRGEHLICHPGTHTKWARMIDGRIETFVTAMTGELFALLRQHSSLRAPGGHDDESAFKEGLVAAGDGGGLAARLFTTRARVVGGAMDPAKAESYLSGLLIGADTASTPAMLGAPPGARITIIGDPTLCGLYEQALRNNGYKTASLDGDEAVLAGLIALGKKVVPPC